MKKMYWILLLFCGALAFPACSDDDNNTDDGKEPTVPEVPEVVYKQVKTITKVDGDYDENGNPIDAVYTPKYNEKGQLSEDFYEKDFKYVYTDTKVTRSMPDYVDPTGSMVHPALMEWTLKSGAAESFKFTSRWEGVEIPYNINCAPVYNGEGYLSTVTTTFVEDGESTVESSETFTFSKDGNMTKYVYLEGDKTSEYDEYVYTMTPGTYENKANIDWFCYLECFENDYIAETFRLGLAGKRSAKLPSAITMVNSYFFNGDDGVTVETIDYTFDYLADKDGNVTQITINEDGEESAVYKIGY